MIRPIEQSAAGRYVVKAFTKNGFSSSLKESYSFNSLKVFVSSTIKSVVSSTLSTTAPVFVCVGLISGSCGFG